MIKKIHIYTFDFLSILYTVDLILNHYISLSHYFIYFFIINNKINKFSFENLLQISLKEAKIQNFSYTQK